MLASNLVFAVADLHVPRAVLLQLYLLKCAQVALALGALWVLPRQRTDTAVQRLLLVASGTVCLLVAASGILVGDSSRVVVLSLTLTWGAAALIPWSASAQLTLSGVAGAAILASLWFTRNLSVMASYPALAAGLGLGISGLLTQQFDRQRRAVAREYADRRRAEAALRQAHDRLELCIAERTSQLRATADALRESERRFRIVSALTSDYAYAFRVEEDLTATIEWLTEASFQRITGFPLAEADARGGGLNLVHPSDHPIIRQRLENLLAGRPDTSEFRIVTKSGAVRWIREHGEPEWDEAHTRVVRIYGAAQDITERQRTEAALRASEERFRVLAEQSWDVTLLTGADTLITYASPSLTRLMGYTLDEVVGQPGIAFIHPDDHGYALQRFAELVDRREGAAREARFRVRHKDGSWRWVESVGSNLLDTPGVGAIFTTLRDITERKRAEEAVQQAQKQLTRILSLSPVVIYSLQFENERVISVWNSDNITRVTGYARDETLSIAWWLEHIHPDDLGCLDLAATLTQDHLLREFRVRYADGSYAWIRDEARIVRDAAGRPLEMVGAWADVTDRKHAEQRTALLLEFSQDIRGTLDVDELLDRVQQRTARVLPCDRVVIAYRHSKEHVFRTIADYGFAPHHRAAVRALAFGADEPFGGRLSSGETIVVNNVRDAPPLVAALAERFGITALVAAPLRIQGRHLGSLIALRTSGSERFDANQASLCTGIASQLVIAIEALQLQRQQHEEAMIAAALGRVGQELISSLDTAKLVERLCRVTAEVLACDVSYTMVWVADEKAYRLVGTYGGHEEEWEAARVLKLPAEAVGGLIARLTDAPVFQIATATAPTPWAALPGRYGITRVLYAALRRGDDIIGIHAAGFRGRQDPFTEQQERIARGIAELASAGLENARLVEELERASRLKSEFLATMSHELRTPLNVITGYTDLMLDGTFGTLAPAQADTLRRVDTNARELLELVTATLDMSRLETGRLPVTISEIFIPDLIHEIETETRDLQERTGLRFEWKVAPNLPRLSSDEAKLKVVLKNLIGNAAKFTERGTVTVDASYRTDHVEISVSDTGIGIVPELLPIIFEPFRQGDSSFTRSYGGVGLGLYIVRRLLNLLGGRIAVESAPGRGSTFRVSLPVGRPQEPYTVAPTPMEQPIAVLTA